MPDLDTPRQSLDVTLTRVRVQRSVRFENLGLGHGHFLFIILFHIILPLNQAIIESYDEIRYFMTV